MGTYKYKAFISYSHKDDRWGRWLHRRLETYPLPKNIVGNVTKTGEIPKRLKPIFRDREELAAADDLGDKIEQALSHSENLILICSPAAARSHWVNQEVLYFKRHNRGAQIFSVIVEGEPYASNMLGREAEECFPPALRYQLDEDGNLSDIPAEPLAADLRDHADGKRLGVLKLVSGMIGVGLDEVVQRDMKRSRRRVTAITSGALAILLAMGTLTGFALNARSEAEQRRSAAEGLIEFMLTDLKDKLEPNTQLDTIGILADKINDYYKVQNHKNLNCADSSRRARGLHFSASISDDLQNYDELRERAEMAYSITLERLEKCQNDDFALIDHGHSLYNLGVHSYRLNNISDYEKYSQQYLEKVEEFCALRPNDDYCHTNMAYVLIDKGIAELKKEGGNRSNAKKFFESAIDHYAKSQNFKNGQFKALRNHADVHGWLAEAFFELGQFQEAKKTHIKEQSLLNAILKHREKKFRTSEIFLLKDIIEAKVWEARTKVMNGHYKEALVDIDENVIQIERLLERAPNSPDLKISKLRGLLIQAVSLFRSGDEKSACSKTKEAIIYQNENSLGNENARDYVKVFKFNFDEICKLGEQ